MKNNTKIITTHVFPPIPIRRYDWSAVRDGYEPGQPIGWGYTEEQAIHNLKVEEGEIYEMQHQPGLVG